MKLSTPNCPICAEPAIGTVETIPGVALFDAPGALDVNYLGETKPDWNAQETLLNHEGLTLVECRNGHRWGTAVDGEAGLRVLEGEYCALCHIHQGHSRTCPSQLETRAQRVALVMTAGQETAERAGVPLDEIREGLALAEQQRRAREARWATYGDPSYGGVR